MLFFLSLIILGIGVGLLGAILGMGGGIIMVPVLTFIFNLEIHQSIAISLVVITANSMANSSVYLKNGMANMNLGIALSVVSVIGALIGSKLVVILPANVVMIIFGVIQFIMAYLTYLKTKTSTKNIEITEVANKTFFYGEYKDGATNTVVKYNPIRVKWNFLFGTFSGIFSGLSGAGGGALIIPGMNVISNIPIKAATATSSFIIGFTSAAGSLVFMQSGIVDVEIVSLIILGIVIGTFVAMKFFSKITDKKVAYILIALFVLVGIQMIVEGVK